MKIAQRIKMFVFAAGVFGALLGGQVPVSASSSGRGGGQDIIVFGIVDSVADDDQDEGEVAAAASNGSKPEYKYVPVRP